MNATERARRSDSLYYDTQVTNRRALCDMIAHLESDLEESKADNAQLRGRITTQKQTIQAYRDESREWREVAERAQAENAKLREKLAKARDPQRIGGTADPESFVYAIEQLREFRWQHATNDEEAIPYINNVADAHERENAKLRELVRWMYDRMDESCAVQHPYAPAPISYDLLMQALARVRELGIEVDR